MTASVFLMLLSLFSTITCLITEGIKKIVKDKENLSYNIIALIVALIIGAVGCAIYYQLSDIAFTVNNIIYMILMGFSSGLASMVGFDKVKQTVLQIVDKPKEN